MQLAEEIDRRCRVAFSLRDLRIAKGLTQGQLASALGISKSLYHAIEGGVRKPSADVLMILASIYKTSMDFVYHAFHRQHIIWNFTEDELLYALQEAKKRDIVYLRERSSPEGPPSFDFPKSIIASKNCV